jgi:hypothetical protein
MDSGNHRTFDRGKQIRLDGYFAGTCLGEDPSFEFGSEIKRDGHLEPRLNID